MNKAEAGRFSLMILLLLPSLAATARASEKPVVSIAREDAHFKINASIDLPLTPCIAYRLLTDYESLPSYIPGMLQIRYKRISANRVNVWHQGEVQVLFFRVKVESSLEMEEIPERGIIFRQTEGDLESYRGEWNLMTAPAGTRVSYNALLSLKSDQYMPEFIVKSVLENEVRKRFDAIAKEASARKNKVLPECGPRK
ncbi:MAG: SRPBCC family protein [Gallionella sp.]|nr:SRPBCC family protein [Gallionella sp.]